MRGAVVLFMLSGCAEISGLAELEVGDATSPADVTSNDVVKPDANVDASADAHDSGSDASDASDATVVTDGSVTCKVPSDCPGAICCEAFSGGTGTIPSCSYDADIVTCAAPSACPTSIGFNCAENDLFRRCAVNSDCTEPSYPKCCTGKIGDAGTRTVCLSASVAQLIGATCL